MLGIVAASFDKLAGNAGSLGKDASATNPGPLLQQTLADVIGSERNVERLPPPDLMPDSSNAMSDSMSDSADSMPTSAADQIDIVAQLAGDSALPKAKLAVQVSPTSTSESDATDIVPPSTAKQMVTVGSEAATPAAPRSAPSAPYNEIAPNNEIEPDNTASFVLRSALKAIAPTATPSDSLKAPPLVAASPPSLSKPPLLTPTTSDATPPTTDISPASANNSAPVPPAKTDAQATPLVADANTNSGANSDAKLHTGKSQEALSGPALEPGPSLPSRLSAVPTAFEAPPGVAAAVTAHLPAPSHSTPAAIPAHLPSGAPIALADLPLAIALQTKSGRTRFAIRLDPPELGRIDVRLDIDNRSNVMLRLVAERPETLEFLRRDAAHIERTLQDAGLKTGDQALQFSLQNHSDSSGGAQPEPAHLLVVEEASGPTLAQIYARPAGLGVGIDIRV
ncbi:MAG TPA: flagellar hook-length control protein FliK [Xanthobacteraceae bacterium]|nr:flagellar hook-length control protein FliK [Xanthobacteraceae bacterium]